jgi:hypothetical protein
MGMVFEGHLSAPRDRMKASSGVIGERVKMQQERKQKRTLQVKRIFEADRMAPVNLQVAYEQVVPSDQYWIISPERNSEKPEMSLPMLEEVLA